MKKINLKKIDTLEVVNYKSDNNSNYNTWEINGTHQTQTQKLEISEVRKNWYLGNVYPVSK